MFGELGMCQHNKLTLLKRRPTLGQLDQGQFVIFEMWYGPSVFGMKIKVRCAEWIRLYQSPSHHVLCFKNFKKQFSDYLVLSWNEEVDTWSWLNVKMFFRRNLKVASGKLLVAVESLEQDVKIQCA